MHDLSVIVSTNSLGASLVRTLESMSKQDYPLDHREILLVYNGSLEEREILESLPSKEVRLVIEKTPGLLANRHRGAREASGDVLVYIDDDVLAPSHWLSAIAQAFQYDDVDIVGGPSTPRFEGAPPTWLQSLWVENDAGRHCAPLSLINLGERDKNVDPLYIFGLNLSIKKQALIGAGGFSPDAYSWPLRMFRGDGEAGLAARLSEKGRRARYAAEACVEHFIPRARLTVENIERRYYLEGISNSFSDIRRAHDKPAPPTPRKATALTRFSDRVFRGHREEQRLLSRFQSQRDRGAERHGVSVRNNPVLQEWVLRNSYWNQETPPTGIGSDYLPPHRGRP